LPPDRSTCKECGEPIEDGWVCDACLKAFSERLSGTIAERLQRAGVPRRYLGATLDEALESRPELSGVLHRLAEWPGDPWCISLVGPAGTGKTWIAAAVMRRWIEQGRGARFVSAPDWMARCQASIQIGEAETEYASVAGAGGLLVLDDLAAQAVPEWQQSLAVRLVDRRWRDQLPTMITTNDTGTELRARYGQRLMDRLASGLVIRLRGPSRRVEAGEVIDAATSDEGS